LEESGKTEYRAIWGYDQEKLCAMGFDAVDLILLDWFLYFKGSDRMSCIRGEDGKLYFWVSYSKVLRDLPLLGFTTKKAVFDRFRKLSGLCVGASTRCKYPLVKITDTSQPGKHRAMFAVDVDAIAFMKKTVEVPTVEKEVSLKKPVDNSDLKADYTDEFKELFSNIMKIGCMKAESLYKKNGNPKITLLRVQKMVEDLLSGDFIEKNEVVLRKTESADWIKDMTADKILAVCSKFKPSVPVALNNFFVLSYGNSKGRSAFVQYCNPSYKAFASTPYREDHADVPPVVQSHVDRIAKKFQIADRISLTKNLIEIYDWEADNRSIHLLCNNTQVTTYGSFGAVMNTWCDLISGWQDTEYSPQHFKLKSKTWDWVVAKLKDEWGVEWVPSSKTVSWKRKLRGDE
jgi:hypothetical protein